MYSGRGTVACNVVGGNQQGINNKRETETGNSNFNIFEMSSGHRNEEGMRKR